METVLGEGDLEGLPTCPCPSGWPWAIPSPPSLPEDGEAGWSSERCVGAELMGWLPGWGSVGQTPHTPAGAERVVTQGQLPALGHCPPPPQGSLGQLGSGNRTWRVEFPAPHPRGLDLVLLGP